MSRAFARKKQTKCICENPLWEGEEIRLTTSGRLVYHLYCRNCKARWTTESRKAREYYDLSKPVNYNGPRTYGQAFEDFDLYKSIVRKGEQ